MPMLNTFRGITSYLRTFGSSSLFGFSADLSDDAYFEMVLETQSSVEKSRLDKRFKREQQLVEFIRLLPTKWGFNDKLNSNVQNFINKNHGFERARRDEKPKNPLTILDSDFEQAFSLFFNAESKFNISPAHVVDVLGEFSSNANLQSISSELIETATKNCEEFIVKVNQKIEEDLEFAFKSFRKDTLLIAAKWADGNRKFDKELNRLKYYLDHTQSQQFKSIIQNVIKELEQYHKQKPSTENFDAFSEQFMTVLEERQESLLNNKQTESNSEIIKANSSEHYVETGVKILGVISIALMGAQAIRNIGVAATEFTLNRNSTNADNPWLLGKYSDNSYQAIWTASGGYVNAVNFFPNGTFAANEFHANNVSAITNQQFSVTGVVCASSNKSAFVYETISSTLVGGNINETAPINTQTTVATLGAPGGKPTNTVYLGTDYVVTAYADPSTNGITVRKTSCSDLSTTLAIASSVVFGSAPSLSVSPDGATILLTYYAAFGGYTRIYAAALSSTTLAVTANATWISYDTTSSAYYPTCTSFNSNTWVCGWENHDATDTYTEIKGCLVTIAPPTVFSSTPVQFSSAASVSSIKHTQTHILKLTKDGSIGHVFTETTAGKPQVIFDRFNMNITDGSIKFVNNNTVVNENTSSSCSIPSLSETTNGVTVVYKCDSDVKANQKLVFGFEVDKNSLTISENGTAIPNLSAEQEGNYPSSVTFNVASISNLSFEKFNGSTWNPVSTFNQGDMQAGNIRAKHPGTEVAPTAQLTANNGTITTPASTMLVNYTPVNDPPSFTIFSFDISNARTYTLSTSNLTISDPDTLDPNALSITFSSMTNAILTVASSVQNIFTYAQLLNGDVQLVIPDVQVAPSWKGRVQDGAGGDSGLVTPNINFTFIPSPSVTPTATPTRTPTPSATPSRTPSSSVTPSRTPSPSATPTRTPSVTSSPTQAPSGKVVKTHSSNTPIIGGAIGGFFGLVTMGLVGFGIFKGISKCNLAKEQSEERLNKSPTGIAAALFDALGLTEHEQFASFKEACDQFYKSFLDSVKKDEALSNYYGVNINSDEVSDQKALVEQIVDYLTSKEHFDTYFETEISCSHGRIRRLVSDDRGNLPFADDKDDIINAIIDQRPKSTFQIENA